MFKRRILNILISLDQFIFSIITLGNSDPDETMSSAAWRMEQNGKFFGFTRSIIDTLLWFDADHCKTSYENELKHKQTLIDKR